MTEVKVHIPHQHVLAKDFWIDEMIRFCLENNYIFKYPELSYFEDGTITGKFQVVFEFDKAEDATHFTLRWVDSDWGMMWHPV